MNIATIEQYVEQQNRWSAVFGDAPLSLLNSQDRERIARRIDSDLSPENLTCDGELSRSQVQTKYRYLSRCVEELLSIDPTLTFNEYY